MSLLLAAFALGALVGCSTEGSCGFGCCPMPEAP
eukprot:CAMPEP_0181227474 /NCGR_PEP_ID=MMETSP1096-20121128/32808_1 /TAXON_ID=156174 ORGANISM="Chrysochromulina ericina, Strain CCMP281" /NCGR_SAMPLE_ID=MMETSP1096 /ASSEMBLY_ACC=CAM_ASM_000453 /LENGTH=33 /DNA_ID= /DNA_START= /DNA_END= /DNA_ORIENTATION=